MVVEVKNRIPAKAALIRRAAAEALFTLRVFVALLGKLRRGDVALTVPAPFMLPYAVAAAARLKRARSALIMHDLYPDVLVMAGLLKPSSFLAKAIRGANALMFRGLNAVIIIGRDTEALLLRYRGVTRDKIRFIPNWATLVPGVRPIRSDNPYRRSHAARFLVGLSGNLGFTHDPDVVFEAARLLRDDPDIHFLLSGWGIGFERLKQMQSEANLPNVTLVERVPEEDLEEFLCRGRHLAHSLSQERRRRIGAEPVLQSAGGRPAGAARFRTERRGGADRHRAWSRLGGRARQSGRTGANDRSRIPVRGSIKGRTRRHDCAALQFCGCDGLPIPTWPKSCCARLE